METELSLQVREGRVRRALAKHDLALKKTPSRSWLRQYYGAGYMVINDRNVVVSGAHQRRVRRRHRPCRVVRVQLFA